MKNVMFALVACLSVGCHLNNKDTGKRMVWNDVSWPIDSIRQGLPVYDAATIDYKRNGKTILTVTLDSPIVVSVAEKPEGWGFFQFPDIEKGNGDSLRINWNMQPDAIQSYGKGGRGTAFSTDNGEKWHLGKEGGDDFGGLVLPNGDRIKIHTPQALDVNSLKLPEPVQAVHENYGRMFKYYKVSELPPALQGVYIERLMKSHDTWTVEHDSLDDPQAVRYSESGLFPVVWWGDMQLEKDSSVVVGIYPGFRQDDGGKVESSGIFFYRSSDQGHSWKILGRIPYLPDTTRDINGNKRYAMGFTEPAFEILKDGSYLCVMRTTDGLGNSPMYFSRSTDKGVTWSKPEAFTSNGVLPRLLQLDNGVIVLASGRPGVQLRFCLNGKGSQWTDPFEMLPYDNKKDAVSCGYTGVVATGKNKFLLVYSDFKYPVDSNEVRKAIKVREIEVDPR